MPSATASSPQGEPDRETLLDSRYVYQGRILNLRLDRVQLPGLPTPFTREIIEHRPAVAIVAYVDGDVYLVQQTRAGAGGRLWEIPAGVLHDGEDPIAGAQRELQEEIGYRAAQWTRLGSIYPSPGYVDEVIHLLLATDLTHDPLPGDADEDITAERLPLADALARLSTAAIQDAKTVVALLRARDQLAHA